jgi:hypothetical protein
MPTLNFAADTSRALMEEVSNFVTYFLPSSSNAVTQQPQTLDDAIAWANATFPLPEGFAVGVVDLKVNNLTPALPDDVVLATEQAASEPAPRRRHRAKVAVVVTPVAVTENQRNDESGDAEGTSDISDETVPEPADPFQPATAPVTMNSTDVIAWTPAQYLDKATNLARAVFIKGDMAKAEVTTLVQSFNVKTISTIPEDKLPEFWAGMLKLSQKYAVAVVP